MDELSFHLSGVVHTRGDVEDFHGPLDLILHLLSKNKIEIRDIEISLLVDQYIEYLHLREEMDLNVASDFVAMASHLVWLKTRMLLAIDDEETREEMEKLIRSLEERQAMEEYRVMVSGAEYLGGRSEIGRSIYTRPPEPIAPDRTYKRQHKADELVGAMNALRDRVENRMPPSVSVFKGIVGREKFPIGNKLNLLLQRFIFQPVARLFELFIECGSRSELVATFLAVLELCRDRRVEVGQEDGETVLTAVKSDG